MKRAGIRRRDSEGNIIERPERRLVEIEGYPYLLEITPTMLSLRPYRGKGSRASDARIGVTFSTIYRDALVRRTEALPKARKRRASKRRS